MMNAMEHLLFTAVRASYFAKQLRSSLEGFPYPRLLSSRIPVQTHFVFSVFRSWDIVVTETIKADFKETRAKKTTPGHESAKRETTRSSHKGMNQ